MLAVLSITTGLLSAALWFYASILTVAPAPQQNTSGWSSAQVYGVEQSGKVVDVLRTLKRQSHVNGAAAFAAAIAVGAQAVERYLS